jgi:hypothetical protein
LTEDTHHHFPILINSTPEVVLPTIDLNGPAHRARGNGEDFVDVEGVAVTLVLSFQSSGVEGAKFDTP